MNKNLKKIVIIMWIIMLLEAMVMLVLTIRDYNNSHNNSDDTKKYSLQEIQERSAYNSVVPNYIGSGKKGVEVRSVLDAVIATNNNYAGESGMFIAITPVGFSTLENSGNFNLQNEKRIGEPGLVNNSENIVNVHSLTMSGLKSYVNMGKRYEIAANYQDGFITEIIITEHQNRTETNTITNE